MSHVLRLGSLDESELLRFDALAGVREQKRSVNALQCFPQGCG